AAAVRLVEPADVQRGDLLLGAGDGAMDVVDLDLELKQPACIAGMGAVHRCRFSPALHEVAQSRELSDQLLVRRVRRLGFRRMRDRRLHLFDAKHLAPYWHRHPAGFSDFVVPGWRLTRSSLLRRWLGVGSLPTAA